MSADDPFDLARFVDAQDSVFAQAMRELRAGRKQSHWMWFVFPQVAGLGSSAMARHYAIATLDEARAYLSHGVLGPRLDEATRAVTTVRDRSLTDILGSPDDLKFRSSMTLFECATDEPAIFTAALDRCCGGQRDGATLRLLGRG